MRELTPDERDEIERDATLPQLDARELVDEEYLERAIKEMYTEVAENPGGEFHFLTGRAARRGASATTRRCWTGSRPRRSSRSRGSATTSTSPPCRRARCVVDLGCGSGTDLFCAAGSGRAPPAGRSAST